MSNRADWLGAAHTLGYADRKSIAGRIAGVRDATATVSNDTGDQIPIASLPDRRVGWIYFPMRNPTRD